MTGQLALLARLARHDVRRHLGDSLLLAAALTVAASSLALGLLLHGRTASPYAYTRAVTHGPDVVANVLAEPGASISSTQRAGLAALMRDPAVARTGGPFATTWTSLRSGRVHAAAEVQGRAPGRAAVDQPKVTAGTWVRPGGAVLEQAFATALHARVGTVLRLGSRTFRVNGIAATAAMTPYPDLCFLGCALSTPSLASASPGLVWVTRSDALSLATAREPIALFADLVLRPGASADAFVAHAQLDAPAASLLASWHDIENHDDKVIRNERAVLVLGGSLLSMLSIATVSVLVGGRLAQEIRRVGLFKAVGATPGFVIRTLLVPYVAIAVVASVLGIALALVIAPHLNAPSTGLLGSAGATSIGVTALGMVFAVVVGLTVLSVVAAALRAARSSTVAALADSARVPRRRRLFITLSTRLPAVGLLGVRLVARRPRRSVLAAAGIAVAVCGVVVALLADARLGLEHATAAGLPDPDAARLDQVMVTLTLLLGVLSLVDVVFIASATAADARTSLATAQALGASPIAKLGALATALALPAALGAVIGLPCGVGLYSVLDHSTTSTAAPLLALAAVVPVTVVAAAAIAAATARLTGRRPLADVLRAAAT